MQFHFTAVRAFKSRREFAFEWQAAAFAKRRSDETNLRPAFGADETAFGRGPFRFAYPADFRIKKSEAGVEPALDWSDGCGHAGIVNRAPPKANCKLPRYCKNPPKQFPPPA